MTETILIVDDKLSAVRLLQDYLTERGFNVVVAVNGREALYVARAEHPNLILLDIMMPEMDGYDFMRAWRREQDTPIILLTARLDETDKVLGLELGADDYITKPYSMNELVARMRAVLRRANKPPAQAEVLRVADVMLSHTSRAVTVAGQAVDLTPSEFDLLALMMGSPGRVFSRLDLLEHLQGDRLEGAERTIDVHIRNLRAKVEPDPKHPRYIETVFGVGYRLAHD